MTVTEEHWRLLEDGELRQLGDQIWYEGYGWMPICNADIGRQNTDGCYVLPVRRRKNTKEQEQQLPAK